VSAQTEVELERPATQLALVLFPHPGGLGARCAVSIAGVHTQAGGVDKPPTARIALVRVQLVRALVGLQVLGPRELRAADGTDERLVVHMLRGVVRRQLLHGVELLVALPTRLARPRRRPRLLRRLAVVRRRVPTVRRLRAERLVAHAAERRRVFPVHVLVRGHVLAAAERPAATSAAVLARARRHRLLGSRASSPSTRAH